MAVLNFKPTVARQAAELLAFAAIKALLNGQPAVAHALAPECGAWRPYLNQLFAARHDGGSHELVARFVRLRQDDATFRALLAAYMDGQASDEDWHPARDLLATHFTAPAFLVPGLLPVGLAILAGRPKLGKFWLALQFAAAVATAGPLLGIQPPPAAGYASVFYYALEDTPRRLAERLARQGLAPRADLNFATTCSPLDGPGFYQLAEKFDDGYTFIVVDTLTRALSPRAASDPTRVVETLARLHRLAHENGTAILLIDHHRKRAGSGNSAGHPGNPIDDLLGGTAKAGIIDAAYGLYRAHGDDTALLRVSGRDLPELDLRLRWDPATCTWSNCGDDTALAFTERQQEILDALATLGPTSLAALTAYTGQDKSNLLRRLKTLLHNETILRTSNDHHVIVYSLPTTPSPLPILPTLPTHLHFPLPPLPAALPRPTTITPDRRPKLVMVQSGHAHNRTGAPRPAGTPVG